MITYPGLYFSSCKMYLSVIPTNRSNPSPTPVFSGHRLWLSVVAGGEGGPFLSEFGEQVYA